MKFDRCPDSEHSQRSQVQDIVYVPRLSSDMLAVTLFEVCNVISDLVCRTDVGSICDSLGDVESPDGHIRVGVVSP